MKPSTNKELEIYKQLNIDFTLRGGLIMIPIADASRVLTFFRIHNIGVHGIDVFLLNNGTRSLLHWKRLYSELSTSVNFATESTQLATELIQTIQKEEEDLSSLYIEFTL